MAKEKLGTIYGIQFLDDGVFYYVGQTRLPLEKRWAEHRKPTCRAFVSKMLNTFGVEKFTIVVLERLPIAELNEREGYWIETLGTLAPNGFNRRKSGHVSGMSEATKLRMGEARKKLWADPAYKANMREKLKAAWAGNEARRQKQKEWAAVLLVGCKDVNKGRKRTPEQVQALTAAFKAKWQDPEFREKERRRRAANPPVRRSAEARARQAEVVRRGWETRRAKTNEGLL